MTTPAPIAALAGVTKIYGDGDTQVTALADADLSIYPGEILLIEGPSGSGKTTLLSLLAGLHPPTAGEIVYDDKPLASLDLRAVRQQIGIVPQHPFIFGASVRENIALTVPGAPIERVASAARVACLHDDISAMPMGYDTVVSDGGGSLSGGQRQRVALGRALAPAPRALLLDEPLSAVDLGQRRELLGRLRELLSALAIPVIYVTHSQEELRFWACPAIELRLRPGPPGSEPVVETVSAP